MNKITILAVISIAALMLGMMTPDPDFIASATGDKKSKDYKKNLNNDKDDRDDDHDDCDDDRYSSRHGNDDCDDDHDDCDDDRYSSRHGNDDCDDDHDDCDDDRYSSRHGNDDCDDDHDDCDDDRYSSRHGNDDCDDDHADMKNTKPTVKVYKVVINNQGNPSHTIDEFGVKLNNTAVTVNGTVFTIAKDKPVTLTESGLVGYEFVEIRGDGHCPENLGGTITLDRGQHIECYIVNQPTGASDSVSDPPTVKIFKIVLNHQGTFPSISDFGVTLNNVQITQNGTNAIQIPTNTPVSLNEAGLAGYEFVEIRGDGHCPENLGGTITLDRGQHIECYIVNQPTGASDSVSDPPTVKIFKIVLNHQGTFPSISDFGVTLNNVQITQNGTNAIQIPTNTPVSLNEAGLAGYEFVEIRGDGHCPENLGGTITLSNGQHIECYIVNRPSSQVTPVEPGVIFHFNTLVLDAGNKRIDDSCSAMGKTLPCVELANVDETNSLLVVDSKLQTDTTVVLFSVVEADKINNGLPAESPLCVLSGMKQHTASYAKDPENSPVDQPTGALGFEVNCSLIEPVKYKFSYALIETNRGP